VGVNVNHCSQRLEAQGFIQALKYGHIKQIKFHSNSVKRSTSSFYALFFLIHNRNIDLPATVHRHNMTHQHMINSKKYTWQKYFVQ